MAAEPDRQQHTRAFVYILASGSLFPRTSFPKHSSCDWPGKETARFLTAAKEVIYSDSSLSVSWIFKIKFNIQDKTG